MHTRNRTLLLMVVVLAGAPVILGGCGRQLRAVRVPGQMVADDRHTAIVQAPRLEVAATCVPVPWGDTQGPVGFRVRVANLGKAPVRLDLQHITLKDGFDRVLQPLAPNNLRDSFAEASSAPPPTARLVHARRRVIVHRRHDVRRPRYYPRYRNYGSPYYGRGGRYYGFGGWGRPYGTSADPYARSRHVARFLSELLESQTVPPQGEAVGNVVFPCDLSADDRLTLRVMLVDIGASSPTPATVPTPAAPEAVDRLTTVELVFEVR